MTAMLDQVPVDRITAEAKQVQFTRTLLTFVAAVFYALGWTVAKLFAVIWLVLTWTWTAIRVGWQDARPPPPIVEVEESPWTLKTP